jgi:hypothetical protein
MNISNPGVVVAVRGGVVDMQFDQQHLPPIRRGAVRTATGARFAASRWLAAR